VLILLFSSRVKCDLHKLLWPTKNRPRCWRYHKFVFFFLFILNKICASVENPYTWDFFVINKSNKHCFALSTKYLPEIYRFFSYVFEGYFWNCDIRNKFKTVFRTVLQLHRNKAFVLSILYFVFCCVTYFHDEFLIWHNLRRTLWHSITSSSGSFSVKVDL